MENFTRLLVALIIRILTAYFEGIERTFGVPGISDTLRRLFGELPEKNIDERIKKIDEARQNLVEGLRAIDELKAAAQENKEELEKALQTLSKVELEKAEAERELGQIRHIAESDVAVFKKKRCCCL